VRAAAPYGSGPGAGFGIGPLVALASGAVALAWLALPLLLVLLMLLFDTVAHALLVLLGTVLSWASSFLPAGAGGGLPGYRGVAFHPARVAAASAARALPCLAGLLLVLLRPGRGRAWWGVLGLWLLAAALGGVPSLLALAPGLVVAAWRALPLDRGRPNQA